jgi:hypothetical protein
MPRGEPRYHHRKTQRERTVKETESSGERPPVPIQRIERRIYLILGSNVMLERDLAELYGVKASSESQTEPDAVCSGFHVSAH